MRIAICDDVATDRKAIAAALDEYLADRGLSASVAEFAQPEALLAAAEGGAFDLYLLDVILTDGTTGIDLARRLRFGADKVPVVFFSTSREFAVDAFAVEAVSYLLKPWSRASFAHVLDLAVDACHRLQTAMLTFRSGAGVVRFAAAQIESVVTAPTVNYVIVTRADGARFTVRGSVRGFAEQYQAQVRLVPAGRSILLNPAQVASLEKTAVRFFSGRALEVPHSVLATLAKEILSLSTPG